MKYPSLNAVGFFGNHQWYALPEALIILHNNGANDRIQRLQYAEIISVAVGKSFPAVPFFLLCLPAALLGLGLYASNYSPVLAFFFAVALFCLIALAVFQRTTFIVDTLGGIFKISILTLPEGKTKQFIAAVLRNIEQHQGLPTLDARLAMAADLQPAADAPVEGEAYAGSFSEFAGAEPAPEE